jgi:hypothetical protein
MEDDKNKPKHEVNEPAVEYVRVVGGKQITFSKSLEEASEKQRMYWAKLTPEQGFEQFYELMSRFFVFEQPDWSKRKIVIDK